MIIATLVIKFMFKGFLSSAAVLIGMIVGYPVAHFAFGMVASAGIHMLSDVNWNKRNMVNFAVSLTIGLGLQQVDKAMKFVGEGDVGKTVDMLLSTGLLPAAILVIVLNLILPEEI